jgi:hypothetical protein
MRKIHITDPSGKEHVRPRRRDQRDPKYALITSRDGKTWGVMRVTSNRAELLKNIWESLKQNEFSCVVIPKIESVE